MLCSVIMSRLNCILQSVLSWMFLVLLCFWSPSWCKEAAGLARTLLKSFSISTTRRLELHGEGLWSLEDATIIALVCQGHHSKIPDWVASATEMGFSPSSEGEKSGVKVGLFSSELLSLPGAWHLFSVSPHRLPLVCV